MVTVIIATIVQMLIGSVGGSALHDRIRRRIEIVLSRRTLVSGRHKGSSEI